MRGGRVTRATARAGGIEGGMSTGETIRVRAAMKPFSTVPRPLATVDIASGEPAVAIKQRTDVCAVPAGGVVGEAVMAFELANAVLEKFGGDSLPETRREPRALPGGTGVIVYLVGMPGAGKTVVGRELAGRLGVPFVDLDTEIEREQGRPIAEIFGSEGEAAFRALEAAALVKASTHDPSVVSCGGGVVLEPANRITLRNTGTVVYLDVPLEELRARVQARRGPAADPRGRRPRAAARRARPAVPGVRRPRGGRERREPGDVADAIVEELRWSV